MFSDCVSNNALDSSATDFVTLPAAYKCFTAGYQNVTSFVVKNGSRNNNSTGPLFCGFSVSGLCVC